MRHGIAVLEPPTVGRWQCLASPITGEPPMMSPSCGLDEPDANRCPACGHRLTDGVIEVSTGITERRQLRRTWDGWQIGHVDPECFGETWYECGSCGAMLPEVISRCIAREL